MNRKAKIIFFIFELLFGIGIGMFGAKLIIPNEPNFDLNISIIIAFLTTMIFALIGIGIPGFIHSRINDRNRTFGIGIGKAALGILIGLIFGVILSIVTFEFLPYRISSFYIPFVIPILCGVIGFNLGIKTYTNTV